MSYTNKCIFAFPRSGTKLLADVYKKHGYYNFGEFFNTFSTVLTTNENGIPYAVRSAQDHQQSIRYTRTERGVKVDDWSHTLASMLRFERFEKFKNISPSIVTVWPMTFDYLPESFGRITSNREILCLRRMNRFEQLLSRCITVIHANHNNETPSPVSRIDTSYFESSFASLIKLERMQDRIIDSGQGRLIIFEDLIKGSANLEFEYTVTTEDQHPNIQSLISNLNEIKGLYKNLQNKYGVTYE